MVMAATPRVSSSESSPARPGTLKRKLAAVAGAAGAAAIGAADAQAVTYVPTAGIAAAQGIPGFSFVDASNVTLGALRPSTSSSLSLRFNDWDVDGSGTTNFRLGNYSFAASLYGVANVGSKLRTAANGNLKNLAQGSSVNAGLTGWNASRSILTSSSNILPPTFASPNSAGQFGFRITDASNTYYGWASLVIDLTPPGQGFVITEAYYNTTPGAAISVGQVPVAVPEPSSMALLGLGAAGVVAWRARRKAQAQAEAQPESPAKVEA